MAEPNLTELVSEAACLDCLNDRQIQIVILKLLYDISGSTLTPAELVEESAQFERLNWKQIHAVQTYLLYQIASNS